MKQQYAQEWQQFFTATIQEWEHLLKDDIVLGKRYRQFFYRPLFGINKIAKK